MVAFDKIINLLEVNGAEYVVHKHSSIPNVEIATHTVSFDLDKCLKTLAFEHDSKTILVCIQALQKIDYAKLCNGLNIKRKDLKKADAEYLKSKFGFLDGGIAPFAIDADIIVVIDAGVPKNEMVYCGSGDSTMTIQLNSDTLLDMPNTMVVDIQK